jgi:hypothetical protein
MTLYYYKADAANDAGSGTIGSPWKLLNTTGHKTVLAAGDIVYARGGASAAARLAYTETVTISNASSCANGSAGNPITIANYPGEYCEFQNSTGQPFRFTDRDYWSITGQELADFPFYINCQDKTSSGRGILIEESAFIVIRGVEVANGAYSTGLIELKDSSDCTIQYNKIHDNHIGPGTDANGVYIRDSLAAHTYRVIVEYNDIYDISGDCIGQNYNTNSSSYKGTDYIFRYNTMTAWSTAGKSENAIDSRGTENLLVLGNTMSGFRWNDGSVAGTGSDASCVFQHHQFAGTCRVTSNIAYNCSGQFIGSTVGPVTLDHNRLYDWVYEAFPGAHDTATYQRCMFFLDSDDYFVYNNTIDGSGWSGANPAYVVTTTNGATCLWKNNICYATPGADIRAGTTLTPTYSCFYSATWSPAGTGNITTNPLFADAGSNDYTLQAGSPCIDTGTTITGITDDAIGAPDMGALEYDPGEAEAAVGTITGRRRAGRR